MTTLPSSSMTPSLAQEGLVGGEYCFCVMVILHRSLTVGLHALPRSAHLLRKRVPLFRLTALPPHLRMVGNKLPSTAPLASLSLASQGRTRPFRYRENHSIATRTGSAYFTACPATLAGPARVFASQNRSVTALTTTALRLPPIHSASLRSE